jgi:hypothetical protein
MSRVIMEVHLPSEYCYSHIQYCNVLVGSISQWNFITLKVQYTTPDYSQQLCNTRPNSTSPLTQMPQLLLKLSLYSTPPFP